MGLRAALRRPPWTRVGGGAVCAVLLSQVPPSSADARPMEGSLDGSVHAPVAFLVGSNAFDIMQAGLRSEKVEATSRRVRQKRSVLPHD